MRNARTSSRRTLATVAQERGTANDSLPLARRRSAMATFISLVRYTDQGIRNIKESPSRLDAAKKAFQAAGGELKEFYLAMGKFDIVIVSEAPDDEAAARVSLALGSLGNVRTQTMRVFPEGEFRKIVGSLK
jgi:uncharacterized protein with GYD domain